VFGFSFAALGVVQWHVSAMRSRAAETSASSKVASTRSPLSSVALRNSLPLSGRSLMNSEAAGTKSDRLFVPGIIETDVGVSELSLIKTSTRSLAEKKSAPGKKRLSDFPDIEKLVSSPGRPRAGLR
jgi:hypothetical protein